MEGGENLYPPLANAKDRKMFNGTSGNVSVTSCEMAVRSDRSEKVHGNIPPSRANNIKCLPSVLIQGSYQTQTDGFELRQASSFRAQTNSAEAGDLIRELVLDIEVNRTDLCVKCVCSLPPPREPNIHKRQSTAPIA